MHQKVDAAFEAVAQLPAQSGLLAHMALEDMFVLPHVPDSLAKARIQQDHLRFAKLLKGGHAIPVADLQRHEALEATLYK